MVGNDDHRPTFVEQMQKLSEITIGILINLRHKFLENDFVNVFILAVFAPHPEIMPLTVNIVQMRKNNIIVIFLDQIIDGVSLPLTII